MRVHSQSAQTKSIDQKGNSYILKKHGRSQKKDCVLRPGHLWLDRSNTVMVLMKYQQYSSLNKTYIRATDGMPKWKGLPLGRELLSVNTCRKGESVFSKVEGSDTLYNTI